jgi:hypothetical protein
MSAYVITGKIECVGCSNKTFTKVEGKEVKFPWTCAHAKREGKNPAIETKDATETFALVDGKKVRHCELVFEKPVKVPREKKVKVEKAPTTPATEPTPEAPVPTAAPANA